MRTVSEKEFIDVLRSAEKERGKVWLYKAFINNLDEYEHLNYNSNILIENDSTVR